MLPEQIRVDALLAEVKAHCMCADFQDKGEKFLVIYPPGFFPGGVQASKALGQANALARMLEAMERHWLCSAPTTAFRGVEK